MATNIKIYAIVTHDGDGTGAAVSPAQIQSAVTEANKAWQSTGIQFTFDPADFEQVNDELLHHDTTPGDYWANAKERSRVATQHHGHVVIFIRDYIEQTTAGENLSGGGDFVALTKPPGPILGHELGHYFHCTHTFSLEAKLEDAELPLPVPQQIEILRARQIAAIRSHVLSGHPKADGLAVFDGDGPRVPDTPADDSGQIFHFLNGSNSGGPIGECPISVDFGDNTPPTTYVLKPDRSNVMSYFPITAAMHFSAGQQSFIRASLANGNRKHLIEGKAWPTTPTTNRRLHRPSSAGVPTGWICSPAARMGVSATRSGNPRDGGPARQAGAIWADRSSARRPRSAGGRDESICSPAAPTGRSTTRSGNPPGGGPARPIGPTWADGSPARRPR